jgi:hypothetical protein
MRVLRLPHAVPAVAATAVASVLMALAGCHNSPSAAPPAATTPPSTATGDAPNTASAPQPTDSATPAGWSCDAVRDAQLGNATTPYQDIPEVQFTDGVWSNEAGTKAEITTCATGDIDGDGADDALAAITFTPVGENAEPWTLGLWQNANGQATFVTLLDLGDRTPVVSVDLNGAFATVVWDTRGPGDPMTTLTIRRTSVFKLVAGKLVEASHTDAPRPAS